VFEYPLSLPDIMPQVSIKVRQQPPPRVEVVARDSGAAMTEVACPHPVRGNVDTSMAAVCKRLAVDRFALLSRPGDVIAQTKYSDARQAKFRRFVRRVAEHFFEPIEFDHDFDVVKWLRETSYSVVEQEYFEKLFNDTPPPHFCVWRANRGEVVGVFYRGKCFIKDEFYDADEFKHARWICPVDERSRVFVGAYVHAMEQKVFALPCFVKYVPGDIRVLHVAFQRAGLRQFDDETDWTSMESHHDVVTVLALFIVYARLLHRVADFRVIMDFLLRDLLGPQRLDGADITIKDLHILLSGKNWTSISNGLLNFLVYWFLVFDTFGIDITELYEPGVDPDAPFQPKGAEHCLRPLPGNLEGDDADQNHTAEVAVDDEEYRRFGCCVKLKRSADFRDTDFISMIIDPDVPLGVVDILGYVARFGWLLGQYIHAKQIRCEELLVAKAYSMLYQNRGCPVLEALARYVLRVLPHRTLQRFFKLGARRAYLDRWHYERYLEAWQNRHKVREPAVITSAARDLVERASGVSVFYQLQAEEKLRNMSKLEPLDILPAHLFPDAWRMNVEDNSVRADEPRAVWREIRRRHVVYSEEWLAKHKRKFSAARPSRDVAFC